MELSVPKRALHVLPLHSVLWLALALSGCRMLGMRDLPTAKLEERYGSSSSLYATVDGTRIHYRIEGNSTGETLVLLHGVLASLHTWDGWVEQLRDKYRIVRLDLPGFGLSEPLKNGDYTPEYAVEFFEKVRAQLGIDKFHLAGNSLGGFVAWYYARQPEPHRRTHPDRSDRLSAAAAAHHQVRFRSLWWSLAKRASPRFIVRRNIEQVYGNPESVTDETLVRYHELLLYKGHREAMVEYFRTLAKYSHDESLAQRIREVQAPTLLMWGEKDRWVPPRLIERWQQDVKGITVLTYSEAGHIPMEEFPHMTARDASVFLSQHAIRNPVQLSTAYDATTSIWSTGESLNDPTNEAITPSPSMAEWGDYAE